MSEDVWQSNVEWNIENYMGRNGDGVTTDTHRSLEAAMAVCTCLENEGFGCIGEHYPVQTWVTLVGEDDPIQKAITLKRNIRLAEEETKKLQEDRIVPDEVLKERFDI